MKESKGYCIIHPDLNLVCQNKIWNNKGDFSEEGQPFIWRDLSQAKRSLTRAITLNSNFIKNKELEEFFLGLVIVKANIIFNDVVCSAIYHLDKMLKK